MAFDPDAFQPEPANPAATASSSASGGFDPDAASGRDQPISWSDVGSQALTNAPGSAVEAGKALVQPVLHPINTAVSIKNIGQGALEKAGVLSGDEHVKYADAVGDFIKTRYGGMENFKHTLAEDPVGVLMDASMLFTGGETALARAPGILGKAAQVTGSVGRAIDPLSAVGKATQLGGKYIAAPVIGHLLTQTGPGSIVKAAETGAKGGSEGNAFLQSLTGSRDMGAVVDDLHGALGKMRDEAQGEYRSGMVPIQNDKTILSWNDVDTAINDMDKVAKFKNKEVYKSTGKVREDIKDVIDDWKNSRASDYWTPEGFDALKKRIGDIRNSIPSGANATSADKAAARVATGIYDGVKDTIAKQAPAYSGVMTKYHDAMDLLDQLKREFSANKTAAVGTTLRKLQATSRNNVTTNYGYRSQLMREIEKRNPNVTAALAGQTMSTIMPRGLVGRLEALGAAGLGGHAVAAGASPWAAAALPFMSPRLVGATAHGLGRASPYARPIGHGAFQTGRVSPFASPEQP